MTSVGIVGASGYTGAELLRLCSQHPQLHVRVATAYSQAGARVAEVYPSLAAAFPALTLGKFDAESCDGLDLGSHGVVSIDTTLVVDLIFESEELAAGA